MRREVGSLVVLVVLVIVLGNFQLTGNVADAGQMDPGRGGPDVSESQMKCMEECTTRSCDVGDMDCRMGSSGACGKECSVDVSGPPEPADEGEACMQKCVSKDCGQFDMGCQNSKMDVCEVECDMKGDAPDESEMDAEQICISNCVAAEDPEVICGNSKEGETGNSLCQKCASECVHLYEGPCLNDEQLTEKEKECETCEHCYGSPIEGPSGQGWDCIVDVKCADASSEFGDEAGTGPGIGQEGYVNQEQNVVEKVFSGIGNFFKGLFGGGETDEVENNAEDVSE
jgi:hypothetical protein